ncbi:MAG: nucleotidyltransferase [Mycoplasmatales bacterium]|nr:nucleotidyltransferase [Mycoplasmatales bacterium]
MSVAIIAEYNPFHNGHIYQLKEAKKRWPNEEIVIIMSGKYVQRGEIAVASFEERSKFAIKHGANRVIELPFNFATQAAHIFAHGAIEIINKEKIDKIFFGSESNNPKRLMLIARTIKDNEDKYNKLLKKYLKFGYSFPKAAATSLEHLIGNPIKMPNDILGLEYCKAIVNNNYDITPHTLKRTISFHSEVPNMQFASASYIRSKIFKNEDVSKYTPMKFEILPERIENYYDEFQEIVKSTSAEKLSKIKLISEGMENLFKKHIDAKSYQEFIERTNSRRYTSSRIKRVMLYVLLEIYE